MAVIGGELGYFLLHKIGGQGERDNLNAASYRDRSKIESLLGADFWKLIQDKVVIDFGCGAGADTLEMARHGAKKVIGVDIQERFLKQGRVSAANAGLGDRCEFTQSPTEPADIIVALDSFEHFQDPAQILKIMGTMLKPEGQVLASFGPTWFHPFGGHLFSVFPWSHLLFSERAQIRWRSTFKTDGATRFSEVEGGLNQMTIARFKKLVAESDFEFEEFHTVPIRKLKWLKNPLTEEFTTAIVRCKLRLRKRSETARENLS
jgi:SAM-dependent methyltransferase